MYQSTKPEIATVSAEGIITAKKYGSTCIIASNGDISISISVIVNQIGTQEKDEESTESEVIENETYSLQVKATDVPIITENMLKYIYQQKETLIIEGNGYLLKIDGGVIKNYRNELLTEIKLKKEENGISFVLNDGESLCGEVVLLVKDGKGKYLYLYNESKQLYELIEDSDESELRLTTAGKYLMTDTKLSNREWNFNMLVGAGTGIITLLSLYIGLKKKYWFW